MPEQPDNGSRRPGAAQGPSDLHVVHVTEATSGGVRRHLQLLLPALAPNVDRLTVVLSPKRADPDLDADVARWRDLGCEVRYIPMRRGPGPQDFFCGAALRRLLREASPCVVHAHAAKAGVLCRLTARPETPVVYSPHAFFFQGFRNPVLRRCGALLERRLARWTAAWVLTSQAEHRVARTEVGLPPERLHIIPNGVPADLDFLPQAQARGLLGLPKSARILGVLGRLCRQKAPDVALEALSNPPLRSMEDVHLVFVGSNGLRKKLEAMTRPSACGTRVHFAGYVANARQLLKAFDLLLLPSRYEGMSYSLLEAFAAGLPVVASEIPANHIHPELDAFVRYIPPEDPSALAAAAAAVLSDQEHRRKCADTLPGLVRRLFPMEKHVQTLLALYRQIFNSQPEGC